MALALVLAARGLGTCNPNPPVGAILVRDGRMVASAYHRRAGEAHAEVLALRRAGRRARGATLYVTLEPCCHLDKRTPPCVPLLIQSGLRRIVVATKDPNPRVQGRGVRALRRAGLIVELGIGRAGADRLIAAYRTHILTGLPLVTLKVAATLDGKIATARGESRWITGSAARRFVHVLRAQSDAVLTGIGTVLADDPSLTARQANVPSGRPLRIVLDPALRIPLQAKLLIDRHAPTLIVTTARASIRKRAAIVRSGADVLTLPAREGRIPWKMLLRALGRRGITSLLLEGGAEVNASALRDRAVDRVMFFLAPKLLGGRDAMGAIGGVSPRRLSEAYTLKEITVTGIGPDLLLEGRVK